MDQKLLGETILGSGLALPGLGASPLYSFLVFAAIALVPVFLLSVTSFIKISVVFGILRNAIGAQQVPSGALVSLISLVLTAYIMSPVAKEIVVEWDKGSLIEGKVVRLQDMTLSQAAARLESALNPLEGFLERNSSMRERSFFADMQDISKDKTSPNHYRDVATDDDKNVVGKKPDGESFFSLVPAFVFTELNEAFIIGFLIFLPFLVVDLVVANLLLGLGMVMVSPVSISLPFKIILFVLCDGWFLLCRGLILGYGASL